MIAVDPFMGGLGHQLADNEAQLEPHSDSCYTGADIQDKIKQDQTKKSKHTIKTKNKNQAVSPPSKTNKKREEEKREIKRKTVIQETKRIKAEKRK